ncbi:putative Reverse transcriptase (RNA dependent DNA polymerase) [Trypanosoma vivax]|uniref:Uncharacterized protein n=1 Tax=Trypanosoma vivax (strain Y486) TaxID=1055687 RepID=F9WLP3_TRYVY|nr:hypothetical protein TRVL_09248 [Trypanosoma vivax]KAH8608126.1 putative Reverse transcriptase (RNA dependent DNA polymerase) [Trypanosoma vivax]KAH8608193.1 putative Reverse transcriptase (RNA dependent DNA polymerase) [Trypanosoma vivax]CCD18435.1 hypothetical protein, conserved [Trypanosoma vivax Y486]|eukprot:CCD18435.1 hypothetical protein, conserved [Trypanosoma vivax Y486]
MAAVLIAHARAFDSAGRGCIVKALLSFGVDRHLLGCITGFIKEREAQVRVRNALSEDIGFTCDVPHGPVLGPLLIAAVDSLSGRLNCIRRLQHGFFAEALTIVCTSPDLRAIQHAIQQGLGCITGWSAEKGMRVSAEETARMLFGQRYTSLLSLKIGGPVLKEVRTPLLRGLTVQLHKGLRKHASSVKAREGACLKQLRAEASAEWGPDMEKLRDFCLAAVQDRICYGVASWWFDASLQDRERLGWARAPGTSGIGQSKSSRCEDAMVVAGLGLMSEEAHRRSLKY